MALAKNFGLPDGKNYDSFDKFLEDFALRTAKVRVKMNNLNITGKRTTIRILRNLALANIQICNTNGRKRIPHKQILGATTVRQLMPQTMICHSNE